MNTKQYNDFATILRYLRSCTTIPQFYTVCNIRRRFNIKWYQNNIQKLQHCEMTHDLTIAFRNKRKALGLPNLLGVE